MSGIGIKAAGSIWNSGISSGAQFVDYAAIGQVPVGLSSWFESDGTSVPVYTATTSDRYVEILYSPNIWYNLFTGAWKNGLNEPLVELSIATSASGSFPYQYHTYVSTSGTEFELPTDFDKLINPSDGSARKIYIPAGALPAPSADGHMVIVQPDGTVVETYATVVLSDGTIVCQTYKITDPDLAGDGWQNGVTASMIPVYAGLITQEDIDAGKIDHAIKILAPASLLSASATYPAFSIDRGALTEDPAYSGSLPMGALLALPPGIDLNALGLTTSLGRMIAEAAQEYGFIITDRGGSGITLVTEAGVTGAGVDNWDWGLQHDLIKIFSGVDRVLNDGVDYLTSEEILAEPSVQILYGGEGSDQLYADSAGGQLHALGGNDGVFGGVGSDQLYGDSGDDWVSGGAGVDKVYGGDGNDQVYGDAANDEVHGDAGDDLVNGGDGNDQVYGDNGMDWVFGGTGDDVGRGGDGNDQVYGDAGNDEVHGDAGDDLANGGDGNDQVYGDIGADLVSGGAGEDKVHGGDGNDQVYGDAGNDEVRGDAGDDLVNGGDDNDQVYGDDGADWVFGGAGDDVVRGGDGNDQVYGDAGNDEVRGDAGDDTVYGGDGNDQVYGDDGADWVFGGTGDDIVRGGVGNDRVYGDAGNDEVHGDAGDDTVYGGDGADLVYGDDGNDTVYGGTGDDQVFGGDGADQVYGDDGNDAVYGGDGVDQVSGGAGNDLIIGGAGADILSGGSGADRFVYTALSDSPFGGKFDVIIDWSSGDRIDLSAIDARTSLPGDQAFVFSGQKSSTNAPAGDLHSYQSGGNTYVVAGVNADNLADLQIQIIGVHQLTAANFYL